MKKVLIILQFGSPHEWTQKFIDNVQVLGPHDWYFQIYTPNKFESKGNVQIIPMSMEEFNILTEKKLGVRPTLVINERGVPSYHITDFLIFLGKIFEDYLKDYDFWGTMGLDCVVGRLDHFVPDSLLANCDVYTDDIGQFNANFCLWRNEEKINTLFKKIRNWEAALIQSPCLGCEGTGVHRLFVTDEIGMTAVMIITPEIRWRQPNYYLIHSHDRLENHQPVAKLAIKADGSLWELLEDKGWKEGRRHHYFGREIAYYHFPMTKKWPI